MTDITLIIPPYTIINYPAIGIGYLHAYLTSQGCSVRVLDLSFLIQTRFRQLTGDNPEDCNLWNDETRVAALFARLAQQPAFRDVIAGLDSPLIGFSLFNPSVLSTACIAQLIRARHPAMKIIAGGPRTVRPGWCDNLAEHPLRPYDAFVHGEGERPLVALINAMREGEWGRAVTGVSYVTATGLKTQAGMNYVTDLDTLPIPSFAWAREYRYRTDYLPVLFSRGCISKCVFCDVERYWPAFRQRTAERVAEEVAVQARTYNCRNFYFCDSLVNANIRRLEEFCRLIIERRLKVKFYGIGITRGMTPELLRLMYRAGFRIFEYGIESGSQRVLAAMGKLHAAADIEPIICATAAAGIKVNANLIVGFPGETEEDFQATCSLIKRNARHIDTVVGLDCCNIGMDWARDKGLFATYGMTYSGDRSHNDWSDAYGNTPETRRRRKMELYRLVRRKGIKVSEYVRYLEQEARRQVFQHSRLEWEEYLDSMAQRAAPVVANNSALRRIAVVDLLFNWPPDGGARTDVREITSRLAADYEVKLFVPDMDYIFPRGRQAETLGFPVEKVPATPWNFTAHSFPDRLRSAVDRFAPDLVFFTDGWYMKTPVMLRFADCRYVIRFYAYEGLCLRQHGTFFVKDALCGRNYLTGDNDTWLTCTECALTWLWQSRSKVFIQEYIASGAFLPGHRQRVLATLRDAAGIIGYNEYIRNKLRLVNRRFAICPSGIDPDLFVYRKQRETDLRRQKSITILMTGRVSDRGKGFHTLRAAYDLLKKKYPQLRLMVTRETVYNRTDADIITFDWLPQEKLPELYAKADICVVPSVWPEPFGIVALEAMASGVPVVVASSGGLQGIIDNGRDGLVFAAGKADDLAAKLEMLITNPELYQTMREQARGKAEMYNWDMVYQQVRAALENACRGLLA